MEKDRTPLTKIPTSIQSLVKESNMATSRQYLPSLFGPESTTPKKNSGIQDNNKDDPKEEDNNQSNHIRPMISDVFYRCNVKFTPEKGLGLFAQEDIPSGEIILVEKPSLVHGPLNEEQDAKFWRDPQNLSRQFSNTDLVDKFMKLSVEDQMDIMALHNGHEEQFPSRNWSPGQRPNGCTLAGKFLTNRFRISPELTGIYFRCAIINHSCDCNCTFSTFSTFESSSSINIERQCLAIKANRDIKAGDEITISYIPCDNPFEERQALLFFCYGFRCVCFGCIEDKEKLYPGGFGGYPSKTNQKVAFQQSRLPSRLGRGQGRNTITTIKAISGEIPTIPKNGIVLEETPMMLITKEEMRIINRDAGQPRQDYHPMITRFLQLSAESRAEFLSFCNWRSKPPINDVDRDLFGFDDNIPSPERLLGIWRSNCFPLDDGLEGVFPIISNLNHSCHPNCRLYWYPEQKTLNLIAMESLEIGDKITICYDHDEVYGLTVAKRQQYLREKYGFNCRCAKCIKWVSWDKLNQRNTLLYSSQLRPYPSAYKLSESSQQLDRRSAEKSGVHIVQENYRVHE